MGLLDVQPEDLVVGLGSGSFCYCAAMLRQVSLRYQMILVDPSPRKLRRLETLSSVRAAVMSALDFARFPMQWNKAVFDDGLLAEYGCDADDLLRLVFARLEPGGRIVAVRAASAGAAARERSLALARRARACGLAVELSTLHRVADRWDLVMAAKPALA